MKKVLQIAVLLFISIHSYGQQNYFTTEELSVPVKGGVLYGTLFKPVAIKKPLLVLIIAGSGPTDRDGNSIGLAGKNNSLLQLADSLVKNGIASFRFDKRGIGQSKMQNMKEDSILFSDMVNDVLAWCQLLKNKSFKKIFIIGHSEGSLIGMSVAAQFKTNGFISLAGAGKRADLILKEQLATLPDSLKAESFRNIDTLAAGKKVNNPNKVLYSLFRPSVQPYMISWFQYDPQKIIQQLKCPVLIIQGTNDLQIKETDAASLNKAKPTSQLVLIKNMNHVLKKVVSDKKEDNFKAYSDSSLAVMHELIVEIVNFINAKK